MGVAVGVKIRVGVLALVLELVYAAFQVNDAATQLDQLLVQDVVQVLAQHVFLELLLGFGGLVLNRDEHAVLGALAVVAALLEVSSSGVAQLVCGLFLNSEQFND